MRAAVVLTLALLVAATVAGCSNPKAPKLAAPEDVPLELPEIGTERGTDFVTVGAPTWKPGYQFTYQEEGAIEAATSGESPQDTRATAQARTWGPRQSLNYTVVNTDEAFGEPRFLALQHDEHSDRARLLSFDPTHLAGQDAYVSTYCPGHGRGDCGDLVYAWGDQDEAAPLDFPLTDKAGTKQSIKRSATPPLPLGPVTVTTRVLGFKEVQGPYGAVQAVHVHQERTVNLTLVEQEWSGSLGPDVTDLRLDGELHGTRDVFYAPALLNVVLDQAVSFGHYNGSYRRDGELQGFEESWRAWSAQRLTAMALETAPATPVQELAAMLMTGSPASGSSGAGLSLAVNPSDLNVAEDEFSSIVVSLANASAVAQVDVLVYDGQGNVAASTTQNDLVFGPEAPGSYLVVAYARDAKGEVVDRQSTVLYAFYFGSMSVACDPVMLGDVTGCPAVAVPMGYSIAFLSIEASFSEPSAVPVPGRLVLDFGDGQSLTSERQGTQARLDLESPSMDPFEVPWTLDYESEAGAMTTVTYFIEVWPGWLSPELYAMTMMPAR